eukprot:scaffold9496_cov135-Isochrysis_galbana.AAC.3
MTAVSTMRPVHLVGRLVKHEEELGELENTFSHQFSMVGGTNCTLHNNQVTQGPTSIVDARYEVCRPGALAISGATYSIP